VTAPALDLEPLAEADLDDALALSTQAGWNQLRVDWERLLALDAAAVAGRVDGEVVATATALGYDGAAWIGMVLVEESHRSQGYGTRVFRAALEAARGTVGLDATDLGVPVYRKEGFRAVRPITRWCGTPTASSAAVDVDVEPFEAAAVVAGLDRTACGVDREALLSRLLAEAGTVGLLARAGDEIDGYAVLRPGREHAHLGPVVADDPGTVRALLGAAGARHDGSLLVDALGEGAVDADGERGGTLAAAGLSVQRRLTRMTRDGTDPLGGPRTVAAAGFELG
jgi:GNAT superfamily N-acetyltransferase